MGKRRAENVGKAMKRAITSPACKAETRGTLCASYLSWVELLAEGRYFPGVALDYTHELSEAHRLVDKEVLKRPHLLVHAGMEEYFEAVSTIALDNCRRVLSSDTHHNIFKKGNHGARPCLDFARTVTEAAVERDDQRESFWAAREEVETLAGNVVAANQVRSRRRSSMADR